MIVKLLTLQDASPVLTALSGSPAILVGGQAIAFWSDYYNIASDLPAITRDIDFYGGSDAVAFGENALSLYHVEAYLPDLDDSTPNSGKLTCTVNGQSIEIDFLYSLIGLSDDEIESTATSVEFQHNVLNVLHPLLCLKSKVNNLAVLIGKRTPEGIEQVRLSIEIVSAYLNELLAKDQRAAIKICEHLFRLALRESALFVNYQYNLDVIDAIPIDQFNVPEFIQTRVPQVIQQINDKRAGFEKLMQRKIEQFGHVIESERFRA